MKRLQQQAAYITTLEPEFQALSDDELRAKTVEFRERLANGEELDDLLFEAYAAVREARLRESDQRMFDVQLMGGIVLHEGDVAEMKTGEGKTFVASLALYLNALPTVTTHDGRELGQGVHLVTVNDYLAQRDAEWNRPRLRAARPERRVHRDDDVVRGQRKLAYEADITYGTNSEFGFDYLRDNMSVSLEGVVQRGHPFAIVDEVDSILIDEARTPLIISGEPTTAAKTYHDFARVAKMLSGAQTKNKKLEDQALAREYDFLYDEKHKTVSPTELGIDKVERALKIEHLYDAAQRPARQPPEPGAEGGGALQARRRLRRRGRRGQDRRRVHRPDHGRPPLVGGPAPGDRGEGGRRDPGGAPDARHDHAAELLPPLREARRHDRHREDRGEGVRRDLRPRRRPDPDQRRRRSASTRTT